MDEDVTSIHITEVLSSLKIMDLLEEYPNLEKITCSPSVYNRTSNKYIEALNQLDIDVVKDVTYDNNFSTIEEIYNKINDVAPFTIKGYRVKIDQTNKNNFPKKNHFYPNIFQFYLYHY